MMTASEEDKAAARRILGLPPMPVGVLDARENPRTPHGSFRNGKSPSLRDPDYIDRHGRRSWGVASESTAGVKYDVTERYDTKYGGTYFLCTCQSWPMMRGKGRDCKHIKEVVA